MSETPDLTINFDDGNNEKVSIIIVHSKDQPEYLSICVQSLYVNSHLNNYEVIVVDNGSGQETQDYLNALEQEGIKVVRNNKNIYWSEAANKGVSVADKNSKYFIFLHHDVVILNKGWIDAFINVATSANSGYIGVELASMYWNKVQSDYIPEYCLLISKECFEDIGPWPEDLPQLGHSYILTQRALKKGYSPQAMKNHICHHYKNFSLEPDEFKLLQEKAAPVMAKLLKELQYGI